MPSSIDALDLPIQFFALGTAIGMLAALIRYHRTGELDSDASLCRQLRPSFVGVRPSDRTAGGDTLIEMKPQGDFKTYTLRRLLFYLGLVMLAGALVGALANAMDWSSGLIYGIGLPVCTLIVTVALREGLFGSPRHSAGEQHHHHHHHHA